MENDTPFDVEQLLSPEFLSSAGQAIGARLEQWLTSPAFYAQLGLALGAFVLAGVLARLLKSFMTPARAPETAPRWRGFRERVRPLWFWLIALGLLSGAVRLSEAK
ncbi:MAG: hypothetical protein AAFU65_15645, partial [Pseudomonadota bacterium]